MSENRRWLSIADLMGPFVDAKIAVIGAPLGEGSLTPGRCDLGPATIRAALKRMSSYDIDMGTDLADLHVFDAGDLDLKIVSPADAFVPIRDAVAAQAVKRDLTILLGGNNAITRGGVHGLEPSLKRVGLLTLDAHLDLRDTDLGLNNGNPIQALLDDGLPGAHIVQIGLAPFANTNRAHEKAKKAGIRVHTLKDCAERGLLTLVRAALDLLASQCECIYVDFDIDAIERSQMPAAPGARPGGIDVKDFFAATRLICAHRKVRAIDLAEFDPSFDVSDIGSLVAARWFAEVVVARTS
jgi:arginase family enzyme